MKPLVFLGMPTYGPNINHQVMGAMSQATQGDCNIVFGPVFVRNKSIGSPSIVAGSLLSYVFNQLWCAAWNLRSHFRITHFAMLHADVEPLTAGWLDLLVEEMARLKAGVVSTVIPFKDPNGIGFTSTGLGDPLAPLNESGITGDCRRLMLKEVYKLPETFCAADTDSPDSVLLLNTGCWVCDFTQPWVDERDARGRLAFKFTIHDDIYVGSDGYCHPETRGEDWNASYFWHSRGVKQYATRKVKAMHHGNFPYGNLSPWGDWEIDKSWLAVKELQKKAQGAAEAAPCTVPVEMSER